MLEVWWTPALLTVHEAYCKMRHLVLLVGWRYNRCRWTIKVFDSYFSSVIQGIVCNTTFGHVKVKIHGVRA